jgi:Astacin (Peptidase family M12A)
MGSREGQDEVLVCTPRYLPPELIAQADEIAYAINPKNRPPDEPRDKASLDEADRLALLRRVYWGKDGVRLTVGFLDDPPGELRARIVSHMNAWSRSANVAFVESSIDADADVRVARERTGHWSYLGTDIRAIPRGQPTMNLQGFTMATPEADFVRVVRHETGHTLGFPHEHARAALVARLDRGKVIDEFMAKQRWTERQVIQQVLRPLEEGSLFGSPMSDADSIMCYQFGAHLTVDGVAIPGGVDIDELDHQMAASFYPRP